MHAILSSIEALEQKRPIDRTRYQEALKRLARCLHAPRPQATQAAIWRWLHAVWSAPSEAIVDALTDLVAEPCRLADRVARAAIAPPARPNLRAYLLRWVHWRARELTHRHIVRHARRELRCAPSELNRFACRPPLVELKVLIAQLRREFPEHQALLDAVMAGETVVELCQALGRSRGYYYERRRAIAAWAAIEGRV